MADDIVIINNPPTRRESKSGKVRYTVEVKSEPLVHSFDPKTLGKIVAEALAEELRKKILNITQQASARTIKARESAVRAITKVSSRAYGPTGPEKYGPVAPEMFGPTLKDKRVAKMPNGAWANARYSGGRMGMMLPNQSDKMFNDSGRLAQSIKATPKDDEWIINVAANRFDPTTTGGELGVRRIWNRLVSLVPAFGNPALLFSEESVKGAVKSSLESLLVKAQETRDRLTEQRAKAALGLVKQVVGSLRLVG
jgi:hypothetical protein